MRRIAAKWAEVNGISRVPLCGEPFVFGEMVTFTNDYGVVFTGNKVIGFSEPIYPGSGTVYLDNSSYWFPNKVSQLTSEGRVTND